MIKIEKTEVHGFEAAIRGMRNPMESWENSDSMICPDSAGFEDCHATGMCQRKDDNFENAVFCVGENDLKLMKKLSTAGNDHAKYLRMINVTCDITAPLYYWKEFDTYKVGTVANSCSTMHKIHAKEFTLDDFSHEHLLNAFEANLELLVSSLNAARDMFLETKDKAFWWQMIQLLPSSYNQKRTVQMNYQVLKNMYHARKNHKLDEWREFCKWVETLPYKELITGDTEKE